MPRYELCYILSASVSDDQVPAVTEQIQKFITDFGGTNLIETQLGKKKLAYPIKKTRNGFYVADQFEMPANKINDLEAKIRTQTATIIRHIVVNLEEHLAKLDKDRVAQASLPKRKEETDTTTAPSGPVATKAETAETEAAPAKEPVKLDLDTEALDKKIEEALSENIK